MPRLSLEPHDYVGVTYDEAHRRFYMRSRSITTDVAEAPPQPARYNIRGEVWYDSWKQPSLEASSFFSRDILPECEWNDKHSAYRVEATDVSVQALDEYWPRERIIFGSRSAEMAFYRILARFRRGASIAEAIARFKLESVVPQLPTCWTEKTELSPYQRAAASISIGEEAFAYFMDRGTGKTATSVQRVNVEAAMINEGRLSGGGKRRDGGRMMRVLVICPAQVRLNWQREFAKFSSRRGKCLVIRGGLPLRIRTLAEAVMPEDGHDFSVAVIGYDSVPRTIDHLSVVPWDLIVCDESHYFKDPRTNRFEALTQLRSVSARRLILTGTPIGNTVMDLWAQLEFINEGSSGFTSLKSFKNFHGEYVRSENGAVGVARLVGLKNIPLLQDRLSRLSFSVTKEEAGLNLPDKVYSTHEIEMTAYQADVYRRVSQELAIEIEDKLSGEVVDEMTVSNILVKLLRLAQITSGFISYDAVYEMETGELVRPKRVEEISSDNPKLAATVELIEQQDPKAKTIVWCCFVHNIERISKELSVRGIKHVTYYGGTPQSERDSNVDAFNNDPDTRVIVCNPQTAAEGLNLLGYDTARSEASDTYCDLEIFYSCNWSAIQRAQAEDRAHRRGTRMPIQIVDLVVPGSIDEEILDRLESKKDVAMTVTELRDTLRRLVSAVTQL